MKKKTGAPPAHLAKAEFDCIQMAAAGLLNKEIAHRMNLTVKAVNWYFRSAMNKLGVRNRSQLISRVASSDSDRFETILQEIGSVNRKLDYCLSIIGILLPRPVASDLQNVVPLIPKARKERHG